MPAHTPMAIRTPGASLDYGERRCSRTSSTEPWAKTLCTGMQPHSVRPRPYSRFTRQTWQEAAEPLAPSVLRLVRRHAELTGQHVFALLAGDIHRIEQDPDLSASAGMVRNAVRLPVVKRSGYAFARSAHGGVIPCREDATVFVGQTGKSV